MKAMVLRANAPVEENPLKLEEIETPKVSDKDVLMKVEACGVCHSDIHIIDGSVFKNLEFPIVVGHEVVGVVEEKGKGVSNFNVGDRVGIGWNYSACMSCQDCGAGNINLCSKKWATGIHSFGGYASHMRADSRFISKIPEKLSPAEAAPLFCAGLTAFHGVDRLNPSEGQKVAVVGVGGLAEYAIQFLKAKGAEVIAFSRKDHHLEAAKKLGADEVVKTDGDFSNQIKETGARLAMNFAPSAKVLELTLSGLPRGSTVLNAANLERTEAMDYRRALSGEKTLTTTTTGTMQDMKNLLDLAAGGKVKSFIETMKLEEANEALIKVHAGKTEGRIVLSD